MPAQYEVGDKVLIQDYFGPLEVTITEKLTEVKNGKPGWYGCRFDGTGTWGYDDQIMEVRQVSRNNVVEYLTDTDNTLWFMVTMTGILVGAGVGFLRLVFP